MAETAPHGFVARNNQMIGSVLSVIGLVAAVLLGAGLVFWTDTRGVSAILTLLTIAGGTFTLVLFAIGTSLEALTPPDLWEREESQWRVGMGLPARTPEERLEAPKAHGRAVLVAVAAILLGLALSVGPAVF